MPIRYTEIEDYYEELASVSRAVLEKLAGVSACTAGNPVCMYITEVPEPPGALSVEPTRLFSLLLRNTEYYTGDGPFRAKHRGRGLPRPLPSLTLAAFAPPPSPLLPTQSTSLPSRNP